MYVSRLVPLRWACMVALTLFAGACGGSEDTAEIDSAEPAVVADPAAMPMDTAAVAQGDMAAARDADQQFLRGMSDHHVGLIRMAEQAQQRATRDTVRAEAQHFQVGHTSGLDDMQRMLQAQYSDTHQPTIMPRHAAMVNSLSQTQGAEYDPAFLRDVIEHHRGGIAMIDEYLPNASNAEVRVMAEKMKTVQTSDIERLESLLAGM